MPGLGAMSLAAAALLTPHAGIAAEKYPTRPIHFVAAFPAGGAVDITARIVADWPSSDLRPQAIVQHPGRSRGKIRAAAPSTSPAAGTPIPLLASDTHRPPA